MPSEWAMKKAYEMFTYGYQLVDREKVAEALDAARIKGMEEAAEIVQQQASILSTVPPVQRATGYADAIKICTIAIRNRVKEVKG